MFPQSQSPSTSRSLCSVHGTLNHILLAEKLWFGRLTGAATQPGFAAFWGSSSPIVWEQYTPGLEAVATELLQQSDSWTKYINELTPDEAEQIFSYQTTSGEQKTACRGLVLSHVFNHATHHRGQVTAVLTRMAPKQEWDTKYPCLDFQALGKQFHEFRY
eukprot:c14739_g1_i1.p1 GENE.c14739_g1_i1~~c14739_g1_i1.p1  ORF type:complete len:160 (-),score=21.42 c14739_g1_i1:14-493(-)